MTWGIKGWALIKSYGEKMVSASVGFRPRQSQTHGGYSREKGPCWLFKILGTDRWPVFVENREGIMRSDRFQVARPSEAPQSLIWHWWGANEKTFFSAAILTWNGTKLHTTPQHSITQMQCVILYIFLSIYFAVYTKSHSSGGPILNFINHIWKNIFNSQSSENCICTCSSVFRVCLCEGICERITACINVCSRKDL